jgi:hypothetical protein
MRIIHNLDNCPDIETLDIDCNNLKNDDYSSLTKLKQITLKHNGFKQFKKANDLSEPIPIKKIIFNSPFLE